MVVRRAAVAVFVALHGFIPSLHAQYKPAQRTLTIVEHDIFARVNAERAARGLPKYTVDLQLSESARAWSKTMAATSMHHSDMTKLFQGRFNEVGENIAWASGTGATSGLIHKMWMQSDHHRENVLAGAFNVIGIGIYCAPDGKLWATEQFGRFTKSGPPVGLTVPPQNPIVRPTPDGPGC